MTVEDLHDLRLATSYPGLVGAYLKERGVVTRLIPLDGAVETAIRLGVADAIADVVETGTTLRQAGLELFGDPILESEAILIRRTRADVPAGLAQLERRLNGVLVARNYVMMDYDVSDEVVDAACAITPGLESPTVSPLAKPGWHAVRAMVPRAEAQQIMDDLWDAGRPGDPGHRHRRMPPVAAEPFAGPAAPAAGAGRGRCDRAARPECCCSGSPCPPRSGRCSPSRSGSRCSRCSRPCSW